MITAAGIRTNFFYTVTLPVTLWFLDRGKRGTEREDQVLFIHARDIYRQIDRAHRDWTREQIEFLANIVRLWRNEEPEFTQGSDELVLERFPDKIYADAPGLCAVASVADIKAQGWSLNSGRYVGTHGSAAPDAEFKPELERLQEEFSTLNAESTSLSELVEDVLEKVLGQ